MRVREPLSCILCGENLLYCFVALKCDTWEGSSAPDMVCTSRWGCPWGQHSHVCWSLLCDSLVPTGGKETWTRSQSAGRWAWGPCVAFLSPTNRSKWRKTHKTALEDVRTPSLTAFSCKMIQHSSYSLPGSKKSWDDIVLETSKVLMKTTFFPYFSWSRKTPGEVKQAV